MGIHQNFIGGRWTEASMVAPNVNPSNTRDVVGEYARGTKDDANRAIEMAKAAFPIWSRSSPQVRYEALKKVSDEILARKDELGQLLAREEGKILAEGSVRSCAPGRSLPSLPGRQCGLPARNSPRCGPMSMSRSRASRSAWSA